MTATDRRRTSFPAIQPDRASTSGVASLFDRFPRVYAWFREHLFRDDTNRISTLFWPDGRPRPATILIEIGCGPGHYARRLARRFPEIQAIGFDRSREMIELARRRASRDRLPNCHFDLGDAGSIPRPSNSVDVLVSSRLFIVLENPQLALAEMHRVLNPGGSCFIAEPHPHLLSEIPMKALWGLAGLTAAITGHETRYTEPRQPRLLSAPHFDDLLATVSWGSVERWSDARYQYALCRKAHDPQPRDTSVTQT